MSIVIRGLLVAVSMAVVSLTTGCGVSGSDCAEYTAFSVSPKSATVDHMATAPGNQIQFGIVGAPALPTGCKGALPAVVFRLNEVTWSNPDPTDITISSANDLTNGTAVCHSATSGAVTLTGVGTHGSLTTTQTVQLTCQ